MGLLSIIVWGIPSFFLFLLLYLVCRMQYNAIYFRKYNIPHIAVGIRRFFKLMTGNMNIFELERELYKEASAVSNAPLVGVSDIFAIPGIQIMDIELVKNIYVRDFSHFINRREVSLLKSNRFFKRILLTMEGEQWRGIRAKISPSFTTGRIRKMFDIFKRSSEDMILYIKEQAMSSSRLAQAAGSDMNFSQIFPKYAMGVIASCAFGLDGKCWDVPIGQMSTFEEMGERFQTRLRPLEILKISLIFIAPKLADMLGVEVMDPKAEKYFTQVVENVMKQRRETGERRDDFLQLMMDAQQGLLKEDDETGQVMHGSLDPHDKTSAETFSGGASNKVIFDDDHITANAMLFLLAGFDTLQSVLLFSVYVLAVEPEVQQKLYEEVSLKMDGGKLTYDSVFEMTYLDLVINETLRMYPPNARNERRCEMDYPVPGTKFTIKKGDLIGIPTSQIHRDPAHFPNPDRFIPERFTSENKATRSPYAHMPFGHGPRNCIGMRFALTEVKTVIAQLVYAFEFSTCSKTNIPMEFDSSIALKPKGGMWLNVASRVHN